MPQLKLSLSNGIFSKYTLDESIDFVRLLGFENLEFNMKCVQEEDEESVYTVKKLIDAHRLNCLTVHAASLHVRNETEIPKAIYYGKVSADFAQKLLSPVLVVHSNVSRRLPENLRHKFLEEIFEELTPYAKSLGVKLALENLSYASSGYGKNVAELEEILGVIDDGTMGITIDFCHAEATGVTVSLLEKYHSRICNVHMSDKFHKPFIKPRQELTLVLTQLHEQGYDGPITLELDHKTPIGEIAKSKALFDRLLREF